MAVTQALIAMLKLDSTTSLLLLCSSLIIAASALLQFRSNRLKRPPINLPILNLKGNNYTSAKKEYLYNLLSLLQRGYAAYKHGFYQLWGVDGYITIVSADYLDEMISLPQQTLDFHTATQKRMIGDYTWLTVADELLAHTILVDMNRQIGYLFPLLYDEIERYIQNEFPPSEDWTPVDIHVMAPKLIAIVMGRAFVGEGLNRNKEWLKTALQFVDDVFAGGWKLKSYSLVLRPFAARFLVKEIRRVWSHLAVARRIIVPIIKTRMKADSQPNVEKANDLIQWLIDNGGKTTPPRPMENLAELVLVAYLGSTHTTATTLSNLLFDLAAHPEYLEDLRNEIKELENRHGNARTKHIVQIHSTSKLDSCMKESQRLSPAFLMSFSRIVNIPFRLSNGLLFPKGTHLLCPAAAISLDPENHRSPEKFHGFRFAELRAQTEENASKYQFTTTSPQSMHFGYGRQSCPGRFLASSVIKTVTILLLRQFDIKLGDQQPTNTRLGAQLIRGKQSIYFRRRKT